MNTISKSTIKEKGSYYYEVKPWYDKAPKKLPKPTYKTEIFTEVISHSKILKTYAIEPYSSYAEALAVVADLIPTLKNDWKGRLVYFKENDVLYRWNAFRYDDGQLNVYVRRVNPDNEWNAGNGVCFQATKPSNTSDLNLGNLDSLDLSAAIELVKKSGYKVYKEC